jgi:hypothetical protein
MSVSTSRNGSGSGAPGCSRFQSQRALSHTMPSRCSRSGNRRSFVPSMSLQKGHTGSLFQACLATTYARSSGAELVDNRVSEFPLALFHAGMQRRGSATEAPLCVLFGVFVPPTQKPISKAAPPREDLISPAMTCGNLHAEVHQSWKII